MELKDLFALYRRWAWLLIIGLVLGTVSGFVVSKLQTPVYEVSSKLLVTRNAQNSTDLLSLTDQQLVLTYQQLLKTKPILNEAGSRLGVELISDNISINIIAGTQIIEIKVQDENAQQAIAIANTLAEILIEQNESLQVGRYVVYEENLDHQIAQVQKQIENLQQQINEINQENISEQLSLVDNEIDSLEDQISVLETEIAGFPLNLTLTDRTRLVEKQTQADQLRSLLYQYRQIQTNLKFLGSPVQGSGMEIPQVATLQLTLGLYQDLYLDLLDDLAAAQLARVQSTPAVSQIESAFIPEKPIRPIPLLYTALSGLVGLLIAAGAVLLIDYFDETLRSSKKTEEILGFPVVAEIADLNHHAKIETMELMRISHPGWSNAFGLLRFNIGSMAAQKPLRTLLITSAAVGEGKTTIAVNLAAAFAESGKKVAIIDTDLHRPTLHSQLKLSNEAGLTDVLAGATSWEKASTQCNGVTIITSGNVSPQSHALLESDELKQLLVDIQKCVDVVILDGAPLSVVDAQILASRVDGIVLVVRQGNTIAHVARAMLDQLRLKKTNVIGVVLNRMKHKDGYYYHDGY